MPYLSHRLQLFKGWQVGRVYQEGAWPWPPTNSLFLKRENGTKCCKSMTEDFILQLEDSPRCTKLIVWINLVPFNPLYFRLRVMYETPGWKWAGATRAGGLRAPVSHFWGVGPRGYALPHTSRFCSNQPSWNDIVQVLCQSLNCKLRQDNKHAR